jgi:hypothetical protein
MTILQPRRFKRERQAFQDAPVNREAVGNRVAESAPVEAPATRDKQPETSNGGIPAIDPHRSGGQRSTAAAALAGAPGPDRTPASRLDRIALRAHQIYEQRGGEHGRSVDDWLQAEREIDGPD